MQRFDMIRALPRKRLCCAVCEKAPFRSEQEDVEREVLAASARDEQSQDNAGGIIET